MSEGHRITGARAAAVLADLGFAAVASGVIARRRPVMGLLERAQADRRALTRIRELRLRFGCGPVELVLPGRRVVVVLDPGDVGTVLRERFTDRLYRYVEEAPPDSLAGALKQEAGGGAVDPVGQIPHWLFAFDAAGIALTRAVALLATHPRQHARATADAAGPRDPDLRPYLRACVLESVRLWPTTPIILRELIDDTIWRDGDDEFVIASDATVLITVPHSTAIRTWCPSRTSSRRRSGSTGAPSGIRSRSRSAGARPPAGAKSGPVHHRNAAGSPPARAGVPADLPAAPRAR